MPSIFKIFDNKFHFPYTKESFILYKQVARQYKDKDILAYVNRFIPLEIKEQISDIENNKIYSLKPLLDWFKKEYMKWMYSKNKCQNCNIPLHLTIIKGNSLKVRLTEMYQCFSCNSKIVFPRYGKIKKSADCRI